MSVERPVQLGLCCMNITLKKKKVPVYANEAYDRKNYQ